MRACMPRSLMPIVAVALVLAVAWPARAATPACEPPNVLILLDVSGSMNAADKPDGKYAAAIAAIDAVVGAFDDAVRFGLMVFPDPDEGAGYCGVTTTLAVPPALHAGDAVRAFLFPDGIAFFGGPQAHFDTPMKQALDAVGTLDALRDPSRASHVLLVTDGMQDCCRKGDYDGDPDCLPGRGTLDPVEAAENRADLADAVARLAGRGLGVFVVGFGRGVDAPALNGMAVAAGTARDGCDPDGTDPAAPDACFHPAGTSGELLDALSAIVAVVGEEVCNGLDDDCDGAIDEGLEIPCEGACGRHARRCVDGAYGPCEPVGPPAICLPNRDVVGDAVVADVGPCDPGGPVDDPACDTGPARTDVPDIPPIRIRDEPDAGPDLRATGGAGCACVALDADVPGTPLLTLLAPVLAMLRRRRRGDGTRVARAS